jgi:hypothetical protein
MSRYFIPQQYIRISILRIKISATLLALLLDYIRNFKATPHRGQSYKLWGKSHTLSPIRCSAAKIAFSGELF